ncbi:hypothetical protein GX865_02500 [Candidatus Saccharibacteria bacterium]|nr:hypothetical protein [Candidatus Saccharibacteria bacterium]
MYNPDTANTINYEEADIPLTQPPEAETDTQIPAEYLSIPGRVFAIGQSLANLREEKLNSEDEV